MSQEYVVAGFAVPDELSTLHDLLARASAEHPALAPTDLMLFETAVIEIAANVVEHGRAAPDSSDSSDRSDSTTWTFVLTITATELRGALTDNGAPFEGATDRELPADELAESGRGLALARAALDELRYERSDGHNHWAMVRRVSPA